MYFYFALNIAVTSHKHRTFFNLPAGLFTHISKREMLSQYQFFYLFAKLLASFRGLSTLANV